MKTVLDVVGSYGTDIIYAITKYAKPSFVAKLNKTIPVYQQALTYEISNAIFGNNLEGAIAALNRSTLSKEDKINILVEIGDLDFVKSAIRLKKELSYSDELYEVLKASAREIYVPPIDT